MEIGWDIKVLIGANVSILIWVAKTLWGMDTRITRLEEFKDDLKARGCPFAGANHKST